MKGVSSVKATGSNFCGCSTYLLWNKRNTTRCGMLIWENNIFGVITVTLLHIYYSVIDSLPITACSIMFYSLHPYSVYIIQYMFCLTVLPRVHDLSKIDYVCWLNWKKTNKKKNQTVNIVFLRRWIIISIVLIFFMMVKIYIFLNTIALHSLEFTIPHVPSAQGQCDRYLNWHVIRLKCGLSLIWIQRVP